MREAAAGRRALAGFAVMASHARGLDYAELAGSCAVSCVGRAGLIILVVIFVGLGAVVLLGPAVSPSG